MKRTRLLLLGLTGMASLNATAGDFSTINNDTFWKTTDGETIFSQGGGIFRFPDENGDEHYYWYGVRYEEAVSYAASPLAGSNSNMTHFQAVTCYKSDDLVNWEYVRDVMNVSTFDNIGLPAWIGRLGVAYIPEAEKYALLVQTEYMNDKWDYFKTVGVYTSDTPTGDYTVEQLIDMTPIIGTPNTGDQTVFTDTDGQSYLCYSYGSGRKRIYLSKIGVQEDGKIGLLDCNKIYDGSGREGDCMFRYKDKYYVCASDLYGWNASNYYYLEAESIYGPYIPTNSMKKIPGAEMDYGHVTQTGFFVTVRGTEEETVISCGDRWAGFAGNGNGFNQWCPITFDDGTPYFHSLTQWGLDEETGRWQVGADNNYIKNFSFDADRVNIPSSNKPAQTYIKGWSFEVTKGNEIKQSSSSSPVLNAKNDKTDRKTVMGNFCLNTTDNVPFIRKVYQKINSTTRVPLNPGRYRLKCMVKGGSDFNELYLYAESSGNKVKVDIKPCTGWTEVTIDNVPVSGDEVEVGLYADGKANAQVKIDDISLTAVETTGVDGIFTGSSDSEGITEYYTVTGTRLDHPAKGINIKRVTTKTGTTVKKILVN